MILEIASKLNLSLNVLATKEGFHTLDSVACSADICDRVTVFARGDGQIKFDDGGWLGEKNNAFVAARAFCERFGVGGVDVKVQKNIPLSAGLGGSSADIAGVLDGLRQIYGVETDKVYALASELGSDVVFMMQGGLAVLSGKGDDVSRRPYKKLHFVVVFFDEGISTEKVFAAYDNGERTGEFCDNEKLVSCLLENNKSFARGLMCNGLTRAAESVASESLKAQWRALDEFAVVNKLPDFVLTGSGSAKFALFDDLHSAAFAADALCRAGFNARATKSRQKGIEVL